MPPSTLTPPSDLNPRTDPPLDFPDRDYGSLTPEDYQVLGFMCGLEVHQQLATRRKLFCRCPAGVYLNTHESEVLRHMRPTLSELGEYDGTALMEFKTRKEIVYLLDRRTVCTYELDDTPPFPIDDEAVEIAVAQSALLGLNLVAELHVMRKQYLDGSIPTGFQRTAMVGLTGSIPFREPALGIARDLRIRQLSLEEDSCREVSDVGHRVTFRTDRLGMPLTEAVTEPELKTPREVQAAGRLLAAAAQTLGRVRRGPGAARQDVNVSVAGGRRVEIKGVDNHRHLPRLVHIEAFRQLNLLRVRAELERRGVTAELLRIPDEGLPWETSPLVAEVTRQAVRGAAGALARAGEKGWVACAVRLPGFDGLLNHHSQPGLTFAHELRERVRVIACPVQARFMTHSDAAGGEVAAGAWREIRGAVHAERGDAVVVFWGELRDAATAAREILLRAVDATMGVPAETRQARADGTTGFERILPGADRMYPDTDTPPIPVADATVERIRAALAETPWDRMARYQRMGLEDADARVLSRAPWADLFDTADVPAQLAPRLARSLAKRVPFHLRQGAVLEPRSGALLRHLVRAVADGAVRPEALDRLVDRTLEAPDAPPHAVVAEWGGDRDAVDADGVVAAATERARALVGRSAGTRLRFAMGDAMAELLGRADPAAVRDQLADALGVLQPENA